MIAFLSLSGAIVWMLGILGVAVFILAVVGVLGYNSRPSEKPWRKDEEST